MTDSTDLWGAFIGSVVPRPRHSPVPAAATSGWEKLVGPVTAPPQRVTPEFIVDGLVRRGLPKHVAEGFAMNMVDESGLNPSITERNPTSGKGGYGLYQLTGPRRRQYMRFARDWRSNPDNPNTQLNFLTWELQNTEKAAARKIFDTQTAGEAGAAIVNDFLRPAQKYRTQRALKYLGELPAPSQEPMKLWLDF